MVQRTEKIFMNLSKQISNETENRKKYAVDVRNFSRVRILTIETLVVYFLNMVKQTSAVETEKYFRLLGKQSCTLGAITQRKKLLKHEIFIDLNKGFVDDIYKREEIKRWQRKRIIAVDGTKINLFNKEEVKKYFGIQRIKGKEVPMGQIVTSYDVLNNVSITSTITPLNWSEGKEAIERVSSYDRDMIVLYDRGFPSFSLMYHHIRNEIPFVIRVKKDFNTEVKKFSESKTKETVVEIKISSQGKILLSKMNYAVNENTKIKIRLIKIELENDFIVIATSLKNRKDYDRKKFKELYKLRWGIETYFDKLKNKMRVETFSGRTVQSIKQEFYATILVSNIHSFIVKIAEEEILKSKAYKKCKYEYKINQNVSIGILKDNIVELLIHNSINPLLSLIINVFLKHKIPIIPDRKNKRSARKFIIRGRNKTILNYNTAI